MSLQNVEALACADIPKPYRLIYTTAGKRIAIRTESDQQYDERERANKTYTSQTTESHIN